MNHEIVKLDDGYNYLIIKEQEIEKNKYLYLVNVNNEDELAIRRVDGDDLVGLSEEEFDKVVRFMIRNEIEELEK